MSYWTFLLIAVLTVALPVISVIIWSMIFSMLLPGLVSTIKRILRLDGSITWKKEVSISFTQILFYVSLLVSIPASAVLELIVLLILGIQWGITNGTVQTVVVASAGPIEETMKMISALVIFFFIHLSFRRMDNKPDLVKVGIIAGLFSGACFGFAESIGYLSVNFQQMFSGDLSLGSVDAILWRFLAGVSIHAMYTGLACGGFGRKTWNRRLLVGVVCLSISVILHTLNNGIQGFIFLILEWEGTSAYLLVDSIQLILAGTGFTFLVLIWRGVLFKEPKGSEYEKMRYKSKKIYARPLHQL